MRNAVAMVALLAILTAPGVSGAQDSGSWDNLRRVVTGMKIEVARSSGETLRGEFVSYDENAVRVRANGHEIAVPRSDVKLVRRKSGSRRIWIGAAIGAAAGAGIGAAAGAGLASTSGGDFANLKPAIIGACAVIGALGGLLIGSLAGNRHASVIYDSRQAAVTGSSH